MCVLCRPFPIDNLLDYFLGGADHGGILPPTPEGEPLSSSVPLHLAHAGNTGNLGGGVGGSENGNGNTNPMTFASNGMIAAQPLHHQYHQQQQQQQQVSNQQGKQKNHIRFSIDNGHNMNNGAVNFSSGYNTSATNKNASSVHHEFQPPPTPAVQHFYARSSSNTSTAPVSLQQHQPDTNGARNEMHHFHQHPSVQPTAQIHPNKNTNISNKHSQHISMLYNASQQAKINHDHSNLIYPTPSNGTSMLQVHNPFQTTQQSNNTQPHRTTNVSSSVPTTSTYNNLSPISPAAICTSEVMIFPPPPRPSSSYASTSTVQPNNQNTVNTQRQWQQIHPSPPPTLESANDESQISHTSWLQHVNTIAMNANTVNGTVPISTQQQHQQQPLYAPIVSHPQHHGTARQHHTTDILPIPTTSAAAAAAALHHYNSIANDIGSKAVESKEKREKRLARNRESARQSRRRKKELLFNIEAQVNKLNTQIETERRRQLINMEKEMVVAKDYLMKELIRKYKEGFSHDGTIRNEQDIDQLLDLVVRNAGPNIPTRRAAAGFQCNALRQLLLPGYQQFFLAMSLREESFFTKAKEIKSKVSLK